MKKSAASLIIIFFSLALSAYGSEYKLRQFVEAGTGYAASKGIEGEYVPVNFTYGILHPDSDFDLKASMQFTKNTFDFTACGEYFFPFSRWNPGPTKIELGAGALYHFQRYYDLHTEHDFYLDAIFRFRFKRFFSVSRLGYGFKASVVDALPRAYRTLWDGTLSDNNFFGFELPGGFELYYEIGTHDMYRYPLFETVHHIFGTALNIKNGFRIALEFEPRFRDEFSNTPYMDSFFCNLKMRYSF